jgi:predicted small secreted protein
MKKTILAIAVMLVTGATSAFANTKDGINQRVASAFHKDFNNAQSVSWQQETTFIKATFSLNNQILFAYYDQEGQLIAVVRNILSDHLPILLQAELKKNYSSFWITDLFELGTESQTTYFIRLQNANQVLILKSDGFGHWEVYKK